MFDLSGKSALVTGSTQGIGFEIAECLAEHGARVFVHGATSMEKCESASAKIKGSAPCLVNLSEAGSAGRLYAATGDVDILVLNASVQIKKKWTDVTAEEIALQMTTNFQSPFELIQKYAPHMKSQGFGRILTIGSVNQYKQHPDMPIYAASKSALLNLVQNLARQLAPFGVTVNNIAPGVINTPRNSEALADEAYRKRILAGIPCGCAGEPCDIAPAALLICSDEGKYITGADLPIDGGMHL